MQSWAGVRYDYKGIKALAQIVAPDFEFSERAKSPFRNRFIYLNKKDLMATNRNETKVGILANG